MHTRTHAHTHTQTPSPSRAWAPTGGQGNKSSSAMGARTTERCSRRTALSKRTILQVLRLLALLVQKWYKSTNTDARRRRCLQTRASSPAASRQRAPSYSRCSAVVRGAPRLKERPLAIHLRHSRARGALVLSYSRSVVCFLTLLACG
jgi:hypothetical protein